MEENKLVSMKIYRTVPSTSRLYLNEEFADVIFLIGGEKLPAHRIILAVGCEYFRGMLFGGLQESQQREVRLEVPLEAFKSVLTYIYTNALELDDSRDDTLSDSIRDFLSLAHEYGLADAVEEVGRQLVARISIANVPELLTLADLYKMTALLNACFDYIDAHARELLPLERFLGLRGHLLATILQRDTFDVSEERIFTALMARQQCRELDHDNDSTEALLPHVRFSLMSANFLLDTVLRSKLAAPERLIDLVSVARRNQEFDVPARVARKLQSPPDYREFVERTDCERVFYAESLNFNTTSFVRKQQKLLITLPCVRAFNYMRFCVAAEFGFGNGNTFQIYTSADALIWQHACTHVNLTSSWQTLVIPAIAAKYIRFDAFADRLSVFGEEAPKELRLEHLEVLLSPAIHTCNVATREMGAVLGYGEPYGQHDLLAPPSACNGVAYTGTDVNGVLSVKFGQACQIVKICAYFYTPPTKVDVYLYDESEAHHIASCSHSVFIEDVDFGEACGIRFEGETNGEPYLECVSLKCWARPNF